MKRIITLLSTIVLMLCIAVSVAVSSSAAGTSIANATQIYMGTTYSDSITETGREDYYKFTLSSAGRVSIDITSYMRYYCIYIYDYTGEEVWYTSENEWISTTGMRRDNYTIDFTAGTYYLKTTGYSFGTYYPSTGNYNFKITFTSANETKSEPNNSIADASAISFNTSINGQIAENDRYDYYKFTLPSAGRIAINIASYMRYYCFYLYDSTGEEVWYSSENEWVSTTGMRKDTYSIDLTTGTYYLKTTGYSFGTYYPSTGNYNFKITFTSANETKLEPNNSIADASTLNFNALTNGQIAENDRYDYYRINLSSAGRITVNMTSYMQYYCFYLYDSDGEEVWYSSENEWVSTTGVRKDNYTIDLIAGTYYLKTTGYSFGTYYPSTGNYSFKISFTSAKESKAEPNNSIAEASALKFNVTTKGHIAENDRYDYYKITLPYACQIKINITSYMRNYCLYLYDSAGKEIWYSSENEWSSTTGMRKDSYTIDLTSGTYYLKTTGYSFGTYYPSTGNYTLSVKEYIYVPKVDKIKVSSESTSSHTIKWSKTAGVTGYELYRYDTSKKKYVKIKTTSSTKYKVSGLKSGNTYKYKVRAYIKKNGVTHYGAFSSVLSAGTKPAKITLSSVKSSKPAQLTVTWKTVKGASGYQVFCSTSKKFTSKTTKKVTVKKQTSKKTTVKKLKKGKKYYIRVRAYKTVGGKNLYGAYSTVKSAKIKR